MRSVIFFKIMPLIDDETVYQNIELGLKYTKGNHHKKIESILKQSFRRTENEK